MVNCGIGGKGFIEKSGTKYLRHKLPKLACTLGQRPGLYAPLAGPTVLICAVPTGQAAGGRNEETYSNYAEGVEIKIDSEPQTATAWMS